MYLSCVVSACMQVAARRQARDPVLPLETTVLPLETTQHHASQPERASPESAGLTGTVCAPTVCAPTSGHGGDGEGMEELPVWQRHSAGGLGAWEEGSAPTKNGSQIEDRRPTTATESSRGVTAGGSGEISWGYGGGCDSRTQAEDRPVAIDFETRFIFFSLRPTQFSTCTE